MTTDPSAAQPSDAPAASATAAVPEDLAAQLALAASQFSRMAARFAEVGVSSVSWRVVATIQRRGPLRISEIADRERVSRPTATTVVQRLEEEGLLERAPDPSDSRSWLVRLTPAGEEQLRRWREQLAAGVGPVLDALDPADVATLARATEILGHLVDLHDR